MTKLNNKIKWRPAIGLVMVYIAVFLNSYWVWGILFLSWAIPDIISGSTYFMEPISKKEHPILFWAIVSSWILLGLYYLSSLVFVG